MGVSIVILYMSGDLSFLHEYNLQQPHVLVANLSFDSL